MRAWLAVAPFFWAWTARAADYEIQVYPSQLAAPGETFVELHSNYATPAPEFHETLEITRGFSDWFETGFYVFSSARGGRGWDWTGDHVRPRVSVPKSWGWPVGLSLSAEAGYWRRGYNEAAWDLELRPIVDWKSGRFYVSFNPAFERSLTLHDGGSTSFVFAPGLKLAWSASRLIDAGLEYYGNLGPVENFSRGRDQTHTLLAAFDLKVSPDWELNIAGGPGLTPATEAALIKVIVGRRFAAR